MHSTSASVRELDGSNPRPLCPLVARFDPPWVKYNYKVQMLQPMNEGAHHVSNPVLLADTVAVLFLLDVDNQVFKHMLPTHVRAHFQAAPPHQLQPGDTAELNASNYLCFITVFTGVYAPLWEFGNDQGTARLGDYPSFWSQYVVFFAFVGAFAAEYSYVLLTQLYSPSADRQRLRNLFLTAVLGLMLAVLCLFLHLGLYAVTFGLARTREAVALMVL
jgi:hypothetical protein